MGGAWTKKPPLEKIHRLGQLMTRLCISQWLDAKTSYLIFTIFINSAPSFVYSEIDLTATAMVQCSVPSYLQ